MRLLLSLFVLFTAIGTTRNAGAAIWRAENTWNEDWEKRYADWVENTLPLTVFTSGKWAGTVADCTDTTYFVRIIFSYENKLPYRVTADNGRALTNDMTNFDGEPTEAARIKKFFQLVRDATNSGTLHLDTYPIAINKQTMRPGVVEVHRPFPGQGGSGHAQVIRAVKENGAIGYLWNSVPPAVRVLALNYKVTYVPRLDTPSAGLRRWIWPQDYGKPRASLPDYSEEQYTMGLLQDGPYAGQYSLEQYQAELTRRLKIRDIPKEEIFGQFVPSICSYIQLRDEVLKRGEAVRVAKKGACMNAQEYDDYSTPSRDSRLIAMFNDFFWQFAVLTDAATNTWKAPDVEEAINKACPLEDLDSRHNMKTFDFLAYLANNMASSDPNDTIWRRWGYTTPARTGCPKY